MTTVVTGQAERLDQAYPIQRFTRFFVYGTLRPGEGNYWIKPAVVEAVEPVTTRGQMFARAYPWVDFNLEGTVTGALLYMRPRDELTTEMARMETGAGYEPVVVLVTLPDGSITRAVAWHFDTSQRTWLTDLRLPSGDFRDHPHSRFYRGADR